MIRVRVLTLGRQPWLPCHMVSWGGILVIITSQFWWWLRYTTCHLCNTHLPMWAGGGDPRGSGRKWESGEPPRPWKCILSAKVFNLVIILHRSLVLVFVFIFVDRETPQYSCLYSWVWHFCQKFGIDERIQIWWADVFWRVHHLIGRHRLPPRPRWICFFRFSVQPPNSTGWGERLEGIVKTLIADEQPSQRADNMYSWMRQQGCYCIVADIYI